MKTIRVILTILSLVIVVSVINGCKKDGSKQDELLEICQHNWESATCVSPQNCTICGETTGDILGHEYKDDKCIRCNELSPTAFFAEDYGFIDTNGMCRLVPIIGYNLTDGYVQTNETASVTKFENGVLYRYDTIGETNNPIKSTRTYKVVNNNAIQVNSDGGWFGYSWTITERIVLNKNIFIIKTMRDDKEVWCVLEELLDTESVEYVNDTEEPDNIYKRTRKYYFKYR